MDTEHLQTFVGTDSCCDAGIRKALLAGLTPPDSWTCPKCHCDWLPREIEGVIVWEPHTTFEVHRGRAR